MWTVHVRSDGRGGDIWSDCSSQRMPGASSVPRQDWESQWYHDNKLNDVTLFSVRDLIKSFIQRY